MSRICCALRNSTTEHASTNQHQTETKTITQQDAFAAAIERFEFRGAYRGVFPVKARDGFLSDDGRRVLAFALLTCFVLLCCLPSLPYGGKNEPLPARSCSKLPNKKRLPYPAPPLTTIRICIRPLPNCAQCNHDKDLLHAALDAGSRYGFGLEVGSKAELAMVMSLLAGRAAEAPLLICNGIKDAEYMELVRCWVYVGSWEVVRVRVGLRRQRQQRAAH
jgi:hypothetical protein